MKQIYAERKKEKRTNKCQKKKDVTKRRRKVIS